MTTNADAKEIVSRLPMPPRRAPARAALAQASVYNFPILSLKGVFNNRFCVLIPVLRAAPVANPDGDLSSTENIALVTPLVE
jgi:hypothetical protein